MGEQSLASQMHDFDRFFFQFDFLLFRTKEKKKRNENIHVDH